MSSSCVAKHRFASVLNFFLVLGKSHSADKCKRGHLGVFEHTFFGKIGKNEGRTLWRHLKNLRKKVSLSRKQLLEAFEKNIYIFLKVFG